METTRREEVRQREQDDRGRLALHKHLVNVYRGRMEHHAGVVSELEGGAV